MVKNIELSERVILNLQKKANAAPYKPSLKRYMENVLTLHSQENVKGNPQIDLLTEIRESEKKGGKK